jgi:hypothetical protein
MRVAELPQDMGIGKGESSRKLGKMVSFVTEGLD